MSTLRVRYQTIEFGDTDIHLCTLRDLQQFEDVDNVAGDLGISSASWPLFGVVWPSSLVLAHFLLDFPFEGKRILEVGCGIGLVSIVLNDQLANITATDHHPEAAGFLRRNVLLNKGRDIPFVRTGWADRSDRLGEFDLVVGSDLLYEADHADLLASFIQRHARVHCEVVLVDPGRGNHARFSKKMVTLGYSHTCKKPELPDYLDAPFPGYILSYYR